MLEKLSLRVAHNEVAEFAIGEDFLSEPSRRFYFITSQQDGARLGGWRHYESENLLVLVRGQVDVITDRGTVTLHEHGDAILIKKGVKHELVMGRQNDMLLVVCTNVYDSQDFHR